MAGECVDRGVLADRVIGPRCCSGFEALRYYICLHNAALAALRPQYTITIDSICGSHLEHIAHPLQTRLRPAWRLKLPLLSWTSTRTSIYLERITTHSLTNRSPAVPVTPNLVSDISQRCSCSISDIFSRFRRQRLTLIRLPHRHRNQRRPRRRFGFRIWTPSSCKQTHILDRRRRTGWASVGKERHGRPRLLYR